MVEKIQGFQIEKYYNDSTKQFEIRVSSKSGPLMENLLGKIKEWIST
jgi:hypothetical protein